MSPTPLEEFDDAWVVVAAYNEGAAVGEVVAELRQCLVHVVVVDDGSSDETPQAAEKAGAIVLRHLVNLGQGAALQTGISYSLQRGAKRIATFDADRQHRVEDLLTLLRSLAPGSCDIALGSRFLSASTSMPLSRRLVLSAAVLFTRASTGMPVTDAHNGLRAFTRRAALRLEIRSNRMAHASEILDQIARSGLAWRELPVQIRYTDYSLAKGQRSTAALRILVDYLASRIFG